MPKRPERIRPRWLVRSQHSNPVEALVLAVGLDHVGTDEHRIGLDIDRERLEEAPGFDNNTWPTTADDTWMNDLHQHYGSTFQPRNASRHDSADALFAQRRRK